MRMLSGYTEIAVTRLEFIVESLSTPGMLDLTRHDTLIYGEVGMFSFQLRRTENVERPELVDEIISS